MRIIIGAIVAFAVSAGAAQAQNRSWEVGWYDVFEMDEGCGLGIDFEFDGRADVQFIMSLSETDVVVISLSSWDWTSIRDKEEIEIGFLFRGGSELGLVGNARGYRSAGDPPGFIMTDRGDTFLDAYARSSDVVVMRGDAVVTHFNLQGSGAAVARLRSCSRDRQAAIAAQTRREQRFDYIERDPFANPPVEDSEE